MRSLLFGTLTLVIAFLPGCKKEQTLDEPDLYGAWVKGTNHGDTLWFMKKDGQHIVRIPGSFNPLIPIYSEKQYRFNKGVLSIKMFAPTSQEYSTITSFTWTDTGKEFTIQSSEFFMFMSSIVTLKYRKI